MVPSPVALAVAALLAAVLAGCESTPILLYHSVGEAYPGDRWVRPEQLRAQVSHLLDGGYRILTVSELDAIELGRAPRPARPIVLTFDDGYRNFLFHAYPVLEAVGVSATLYLPTSRIGADDASRIHLDVDYLTWPEVKTLEAAGIEMGSHSKTHPRLRDLDTPSAEEEIVGSKRVLEAELGHPVATFAYPGGSYTPALADLVERAGYVSACGVSAGLNERFGRQRISIHDDVDLATFDSMIEGTWWGETGGSR